MKILILFFTICSIAPLTFGQKPASKTAIFAWPNIGSITVPAGFSSEYYNYREGHVYTLSYKDGSFIKLHRGGMMRLPFFQEDEEFTVQSTESSDDRTIRCGKHKGKERFWCEINFKRKLGLAFPPNISFGNVKKKRLQEFKKALESFICKVCTAKTSPN